MGLPCPKMYLRYNFHEDPIIVPRDMSQTVENAPSCTVEKFFNLEKGLNDFPKKIFDLDPDANDFKN